ncbi:methionine synthase [Solwaraspora sp. WMMD406]|uniref:methionine synthase n=1 Tax=Solwaraspora sp. WMMD406 TaxID=3016095 RepID=UPI002417F976|nr:methionine synthase [Solwaraspora sp. WMMD406]MDG4767328.1 methionine synthase [Solwaraspora sp. WMMD406]
MTSPSWPWPAGSATGIGSLPGTDVAEAQRTVLGELADLPHLAELPARGPGADIIGRGASFLVDLPIELYAGHWRVAARPGRDLRRALDLRERDLDQLTEQADGYTGPLKLQAAGVWTLAASLDVGLGGRLIRDHGAVRDLAASLAEGLRAHLDEVRRRVPGAEPLLQLDEPLLPAALAGRLPTDSGLHTYRSVPEATARELLGVVVDAAGAPVVVHCCAADVPLAMIRAAGAVAVAIDLDRLDRLDPLGEALDAGMGLFAGVVPATGTPGGGRDPESAPAAERIRTLWSQLGFAAERAAAQVVVTPACGLAGATPRYARAALAACRDAGRRLADDQ